MTKIITEKDFKEGDIVFITMAGQDWMNRNVTGSGIPVSGRLGVIHEKISWKSKKGRELLKKRIDSKEWDPQEAEDRKFVLRIYFPELKVDEREGMVSIENLPLYHNSVEDKKVPLFLPYYDSMIVDMFSKNRKYELEGK
jgi:hypothetical protein